MNYILSHQVQPWHCLWRASREQMTRILPLRLMIWQNSHLRFTDALTFIFFSPICFKLVKSLNFQQLLFTFPAV